MIRSKQTTNLKGLTPMKIVLPKTKCKIDRDYGPLFFLAGPVQGGGDWQRRCCLEIQKILPDFYAAIPYYHGSGEHFPLIDQKMSGEENVFERQLNWERYYLDLAAKEGCLIFMLPEENKARPRPPERGAYATDTRGEIARWSIELKYNPGYRIVVGAEPGFHSLGQIQRNFSLDQGYEFPFHRTIEEVAWAAVQKACF